MSLSNKLSITEVNLKDKRALIRVDFNVPMQDGKITNPAVRVLLSTLCARLGLIFSKRIVAALPTIRYALDNGKYIGQTCTAGLDLSHIRSRCIGRHPYVPSWPSGWKAQPKVLA